jgi:hypothetical protein
MELTTLDLQKLVDDKNKENYKTVYLLVEQQFQHIYDGLIIPQDIERSKVMGTCGIYLRSIAEMLHTIREVQEQGFIESAGIIATAVWERAITLQKILLDPQQNAQIHTDHQKAKETPWRMSDMVKDIVARRTTDAIKANNHYKIFYLQYTFLSAIKHGNPYTITHLNRPGRSPKEQNIFSVQGNDSFEDRDLRLYIMLLSMGNSLDALVEFTDEFCDKSAFKRVKEVRRFLDKVVAHIPLEVAAIFITTPEEMGQDFWKLLQEIDATPRPMITGSLL